MSWRRRAPRVARAPTRSSRDCRRRTRTGSAERVLYFTYDASGERVRKVWEHSGLVEERVYLGGFEVYRRRVASTGEVTLARETLHVMDGVRRVALVETKTVDADAGGAFQVSTVVRVQLGNHLGSAVLEVDGGGMVISYEEYHPYGTTAYQSGSGAAEVSRKRYRYTGKERDEETGLYYHGARYYAPWLGRWTAADPAGLVDGLGVYCYVQNAPITMVDPNGTDAITGLLVTLGVQVAKNPEQVRQLAEQVADGYRRYKATKQAPLAQLKDFFFAPQLPSVILHPDSISQEMRDAVPPARAIKDFKRATAAMEAGDYAAATEATLSADDAAIETIQTVVGITMLAPGAAAEVEVASSSRLPPRPKATAQTARAPSPHVAKPRHPGTKVRLPRTDVPPARLPTGPDYGELKNASSTGEQMAAATKLSQHPDVTYHHTVLRGGLQSILESSKMMPGEGTSLAGGGSQVRAYYGPSPKTDPEHYIIEFSTEEISEPRPYMGGQVGATWFRPTGDPVKIKVHRVIFPDGSVATPAAPGTLDVKAPNGSVRSMKIRDLPN